MSLTADSEFRVFCLSALLTAGVTGSVPHINEDKWTYRPNTVHVR